MGWPPQWCQCHPSSQCMTLLVPPLCPSLCHPGVCPHAGVSPLTCPLLLAAPQLLPGAEFCPVLCILRAGDIGALGKGQRETPVTIPRVT